jgi:hypothetical protein
VSSSYRLWACTDRHTGRGTETRPRIAAVIMTKWHGPGPFLIQHRSMVSMFMMRDSNDDVVVLSRRHQQILRYIS